MEYHNEKLLVNKQMVKTGIDEIPNLYGLIDAINKKQSSTQNLADLRKIREAYAQSVKEYYSKDNIPHTEGSVKDLHSDNNDIRYSEKGESVYDTMGETERVIKENEKLRADVEHLIKSLHTAYWNARKMGQSS